MTGCTPEQIAEAAAAGYDAILVKVAPALLADGRTPAPDPHDAILVEARARGMKLIVAILGWRGLDPQRFWDTDEAGRKLPGQLDPFWPEAMDAFEQYVARVMDAYAGDPDVIAFAPTWGIYGEAGFTSFEAGRSLHALARFNEWLAGEGLERVDRLPTRREGPNTAFNRFIRFRFVYLETQFSGLVARARAHAAGRPVGMWQEMYPVIGYLWNMVRVPSADFALYESCFPLQTSHDPQRTLAEAMGFRYRCESADAFRDYFLPLMARKRGEGQRFMGCQLTDDYAVKQYGWTAQKARQAGFEHWEDRLAPHLGRLLGESLESPKRDVLLVFPTYAAATLTERVSHSVDVMLIDVVARQFGCQMVRVGSPRLDQLGVADLDAFRLVIVPASSYLVPATWARLKQTRATVLLTGCFGQAFDGEYTPFGGRRSLDGRLLAYAIRPPGELAVVRGHALTRGLSDRLVRAAVRLPEDEAFAFESGRPLATPLLRCGGEPLLSASQDGHLLFLHGQFFAALCHDPGRRPPANLSGSRDGSANEVDLWGPYSAAHPQNAFGLAVMRNILDHAEVAYRILDPEPRISSRYLGDNLEPAGISANLVYNNSDTPRTLNLRLPYAPIGFESTREGDVFRLRVTIAPFTYAALRVPD
jgi:hypothetical protein